MSLKIKQITETRNIQRSGNVLEKNIRDNHNNLVAKEFQIQHDELLTKERAKSKILISPLPSTVDYIESKSVIDMTEPTSIVGEVVADRSKAYKILEYKTSGGMAHVYVAQELGQENIYAIKMMKPGLVDEKHRKLFQLEVELMEKIKHPSIISMFGSNYYQGIPFFVMEYADEGTLESRIWDLHPDKFLLNMSQVCNALDYIHQMNIIHKDVKPSNILLFKNGVAKLTDFGIAYLYSEKRLTSKDSGVGTFSYMAPEQAKNILQPEDNFELTPVADLYAIGAILYQKFTKKLPIEEPNQNRIAFLKQIVEEEPIPPSELNLAIHPALASLISALLEKDPKQRFSGSASHLEKILQNIVKNNQVVGK